MLKTRAVILAEKEVTYGTDPTPLPASNAILCEAPEIEVLGKKLERNNVKSYFGTLAPINVGDGVKISITTELKGSGTAGTAPEIGPLLEACGMTHTNVPARWTRTSPRPRSTRPFLRSSSPHPLRSGPTRRSSRTSRWIWATRSPNA